MSTLRRSFVLVLVAAGVLSACEAREEEKEVGGDTIATTTARIDRDAEEQAIRALDRRWVEAITARDADAVASLFADEGVGLYGGRRYEGPDAIRAEEAEFFQTHQNYTGSFEPTKIEVSEAGDMAYDIGTFEGSWEEAGRKVEDNGNYLTVWRKTGGEWKVVADITNSEESEGQAPN